MTPTENTGTAERDATKIVVTRALSASPAEVFDAWLESSSIGEWMCPGQIKRTSAQVDARVGGAFRIEMEEPDGTVYVHEGEYLELRRPERLAFTWISEATGNARSVVTIDLTGNGDKTEIVLVHEKLPDSQAAQMHEQGWIQILDRLERHFGTAPQ